MAGFFLLLCLQSNGANSQLPENPGVGEGRQEDEPLNGAKKQSRDSAPDPSAAMAANPWLASQLAGDGHGKPPGVLTTQ